MTGASQPRTRFPRRPSGLASRCAQNTKQLQRRAVPLILGLRSNRQVHTVIAKPSSISPVTLVLLMVSTLAPRAQSSGIEQDQEATPAQVQRWTNLRRQADGFAVDFQKAVLDQKITDPMFLEAGNSAFESFRAIITYQPRGSNIEEFLKSLEAQSKELGATVYHLDKSYASKTPIFERAARDFNAKRIYMAKHSEAPLGYVSVDAIAWGRTGEVSGVFLVYEDEYSFDHNATPSDMGTTRTAALNLTPGTWVFYEKGKRPRQKGDASVEPIGAAGSTHTVVWQVR